MLVFKGSTKGIKKFEKSSDCSRELFFTLRAYEKAGLYKALTMRQCGGIVANVVKTGKAWECKALGYSIEVEA